MNAGELASAFARAMEKRGFSFSCESGLATVEGGGVRATFAFATERRTGGMWFTRREMFFRPADVLALAPGPLEEVTLPAKSSMMQISVGGYAVRVRNAGDLDTLAESITMHMARSLAANRWGAVNGVEVSRA